MPELFPDAIKAVLQRNVLNQFIEKSLQNTNLKEEFNKNRTNNRNKDYKRLDLNPKRNHRRRERSGPKF